MFNANAMIPEISGQIIDNIKNKILDLPYASISETQKLDLYLPDGEIPAGGYRVVIHVHGGAFAMGSRRDVNLGPMLRVLQRGYALASVEYRLSGESRFPALVYDVKAATRFLRAHSEKYNLNTEKVAIWGPSAGGYLASMMGATNGNPAFEDLTYGNEKYSSDVQAVIDWCGPCGGFLKMDEEISANGVGDADHCEPLSPESRMMGAPIGTIPELVRMACPCTHVTAKMPPVLIHHGSRDPIVPIQQSISFAETINAVAGQDRVRLEIFEGMGHHGEPWFTEKKMTDKVLSFLDSVMR